ncbi:aspartate 1-decarboxylase [Pseudodesulfovibrio sp. F-1]|uniref:Aspartate 1-decarboxylase n=1 Tax=Pseudodesulfovibrio alkaliphilus TaxID=2661613 RepID=A0A7K1KR89_9BACT|nr:aspartate 1-decarboxylase [Pseudodesulfovibrio alkaliphilus]MUM78615.1 aspartate 1-decarboxylase [Pseudodesulfovibrio alkaliphilus]
MAQRCFLSAKIHGATITCANLEYRGSISIDTALMKAVGLLPYEQVDVYNLDNGERLTTYAIPGSKGEICLNGAAAHKGAVGQRVIIASYAWLDESEARTRKPRVAIANNDNGVEQILECELDPDF